MQVSARSLAVLAGILALSSGCRDSREAKAAQLRDVEANREKLLQRRMGVADSNPDRAVPLAQWIMPAELREISGLTLLANGNVLAHDDEVGRIYEIDPKSGIIVKRFALAGTPHADFEGITTAGGDIYLVQSNGQLFKFMPAADGGESSYERFDTHLGRECEFEGVAYQADSSWLVLPCKRVGSKRYKHDLVIYRLTLPISEASRLSVLTIPMEDVVASNGWKNVAPSDIAIDPVTGNYVLVAAQEKALIIITPEGQVVRSERLPPGHDQAEGVAVTPDGILIVSDEATRRPADITLYRWRR